MLAWGWFEHRDELAADFQQFYGIDLLEFGLGDCSDEKGARAALLAAQLPSSSRLVRLDNPDLEWSPETHFLRLVEFELRGLMHGLGGGKGARPEPTKLPSEHLASRSSLESAETEKEEVDAVLKDVLNNETSLGGEVRWQR